MATLIQKLARPGKRNHLAALTRLVIRKWLLLSTSSVEVYRAPNGKELEDIEKQCNDFGMPVFNHEIDKQAFDAFKQEFVFPDSYYDGPTSDIHTEKLLEHFAAWTLLQTRISGGGAYVDIAACASPWAKLLRERNTNAYAVDLQIDSAYAELPYYRQEDATRSKFEPESVAAASLQCAYEMFVGDDDQALIIELARILAPGGRAVIAPLYLHTHPCFYQSPEYCGHSYGDLNATAYIRRDVWGITASRKYSAATLRKRVWDTALHHGLEPKLLVLRNRETLGSGVYLHFILVLDKPGGQHK